MNNPNSPHDRSADQGAPHEPELCVVMHTLENKKFLKYVKDRQRAFEDASEVLRDHSNDLKVLMKRYEQAVCNGTPLGELKKMIHTLIDNGSSEAQELLQVPTDRTQNHAETENVAQIPGQADAPEADDPEHVPAVVEAPDQIHQDRDKTEPDTNPHNGEQAALGQEVSVPVEDYPIDQPNHEAGADAVKDGGQIGMKSAATVVVNMAIKIGVVKENMANLMVDYKHNERQVEVNGERGGPKYSKIEDGSQSGKKRTLGEVTVSEAKKVKKEVMFVIFGHHSSKYPRNTLIEILTDLGFKPKNEHDIMADVPNSTRLYAAAWIPTQLPNPEYFRGFSVLNNTPETELLEWLADDSTVTRVYLENKERFGSKVTRYHLVASYSDIREVRLIQFMMHLMEEHEVHNTLENFKSINAKDFDAIKTMLYPTPIQNFNKTLKVFLREGYNEIFSAVAKLTSIRQDFWIDQNN